MARELVEISKFYVAPSVTLRLYSNSNVKNLPALLLEYLLHPSCFDNYVLEFDFDSRVFRSAVSPLCEQCSHVCHLDSTQ